MYDPIDEVVERLVAIADETIYGESSHPEALITFGPQMPDPNEQPTWMDVYYLGQFDFYVQYRQGTGAMAWDHGNLAEKFHEARRENRAEEGDLVLEYWGMSLQEVGQLIKFWSDPANLDEEMPRPKPNPAALTSLQILVG